MALWCNWLTHRPVTAKSRGSSPRRVAKAHCLTKNRYARVSTVRCAVGLAKRWRFKSPNRAIYASLVQLAETLDSNSRCCEFDSHRRYQCVTRRTNALKNANNNLGKDVWFADLKAIKFNKRNYRC